MIRSRRSSPLLAMIASMVRQLKNASAVAIVHSNISPSCARRTSSILRTSSLIRMSALACSYAVDLLVDMLHVPIFVHLPVYYIINSRIESIVKIRDRHNLFYRPPGGRPSPTERPIDLAGPGLCAPPGTGGAS